MKIGRKTPSPNLKARKSFLLKSKDLTPIRPNKDRKKKSPFSVSLGNALRMSEKYTNDPTPSTKLNDTPNIDLKKEAQKFQFFSIKKERKTFKDLVEERLSNKIAEKNGEESKNISKKTSEKSTHIEYYKDLFKGFNPKRPRKMSHMKLRDYLCEKVGILQYFANLRPPSANAIKQKTRNFSILEKDINKRLSIVLDLDETLVHCEESIHNGCDVILQIPDSLTGELIDTGFNLRPHLFKFLDVASKHFEIIIYTASKKAYADVILDYIDPENKYFSHRLYRDDCLELEPNLFVKDLRIIGGRESNRVCLVDNALYSYYFTLDQGIPIIPFYSDSKDVELLKLLTFLLSVKNDEDITDAIPRYFKHDELISCTNMDEIVNIYL